MKRIIPLLLALLLLAACGAEAVEPTPTAVLADIAEPTPTPVLTTPAPAPMPSASPLPEYVPPLDFEPVSVWRAEPFGLDGEAVLYLGEARFKVFTYYANGNRSGLTESRAFSADISGGAFTVDLAANRDGPSPIPDVTALSGEISQEGGRLLLSYTGVETLSTEFDLAGGVITRASGYNTQYLPLEFYELSGDDAAMAMYSMPACADEMSWCPNSGDTAFLYEKDYCYLTDDPEYAPGLRGLELGDSFADIAARLPNELDAGFDPRVLGPDAVEQRQGEHELTFYGCRSGFSMASLVYLDEIPAYVTVWAVASSIRYFLDENLEICAIGYNLGGEDANIAWRELSGAK